MHFRITFCCRKLYGINLQMTNNQLPFFQCTQGMLYAFWTLFSSCSSYADVFQVCAGLDRPFGRDEGFKTQWSGQAMFSVYPRMVAPPSPILRAEDGPIKSCPIKLRRSQLCSKMVTDATRRKTTGVCASKIRCKQDTCVHRSLVPWVYPGLAAGQPLIHAPRAIGWGARAPPCTHPTRPVSDGPTVAGAAERDARAREVSRTNAPPAPRPTAAQRLPRRAALRIPKRAGGRGSERRRRRAGGGAIAPLAVTRRATCRWLGPRESAQVLSGRSKGRPKLQATPIHADFAVFFTHRRGAADSTRRRGPARPACPGGGRLKAGEADARRPWPARRAAGPGVRSALAGRRLPAAESSCRRLVVNLAACVW